MDQAVRLEQIKTTYLDGLEVAGYAGRLPEARAAFLSTLDALQFQPWTAESVRVQANATASYLASLPLQRPIGRGQVVQDVPANIPRLYDMIQDTSAAVEHVLGRSIESQQPRMAHLQLDLTEEQRLMRADGVLASLAGQLAVQQAVLPDDMRGQLTAAEWLGLADQNFVRAEEAFRRERPTVARGLGQISTYRIRAENAAHALRAVVVARNPNRPGLWRLRLLRIIAGAAMHGELRPALQAALPVGRDTNIPFMSDHSTHSLRYGPLTLPTITPRW